MAEKKTNKRTGLHPFAYMGVEPIATYNVLSMDRPPTIDDYRGYNIGDRWLDRSAPPDGRLYVLIHKNNNVATWVKVTTPEVVSITPDVGILVVSDGAFNVNIVGGPGITTTGTLNTLTVDISSGTIAETFETDAGNATPAGGVLQVLGGQDAATTGASNIVTVNFDPDSVADTYQTDSGVATPALGVINMLGGVGGGTSAAGNTVTVTGIVLDIDQVITDSGAAVAVGGDLNVFGGRNITTSASGNSVTIDMDDPGEGVVFSDSTGLFSASKGDDGELIIGATAASPAWANLTEGADVTITNIANQIEIASTGGGAPTAFSNFKAYLTANLPNVTGGGVQYTIPFDATLWDLNGDVDTLTGKFVAPADGIYCFLCQVWLHEIIGDNTDSRIICTGIYAQDNASVNVNLFNISTGPNREVTAITNTTQRLEIGDTAEFNFTASGGFNRVDILSGSGNTIKTWFTGFLLAYL